MRNPAPIKATQSEKRLIWRAHKAAERANRAGILHRPPGMEMHHHDYHQPLAVEMVTPRDHHHMHPGGGRATMRNPSAWTTFATAIQRSLPKNATFKERGGAMKIAGQLWRQGVRSPAEAQARIAGLHAPASRPKHRNPKWLKVERGPEWQPGTYIPWSTVLTWAAVGVGALWLLGRSQQATAKATMVDGVRVSPSTPMLGADGRPMRWAQ